MQVAQWIEAASAALGAIAAIIAAVAAVGALRDGKATLKAAQGQVRVAQNQVEASQLPVLSVEANRDGLLRYFSVRNVGNGPALAVSLTITGASTQKAETGVIPRGEAWHTRVVASDSEFILRFTSASRELYEAAGSVVGGRTTLSAQTPVRVSNGVC